VVVVVGANVVVGGEVGATVVVASTVVDVGGWVVAGAVVGADVEAGSDVEVAGELDGTAVEPIVISSSRWQADTARPATITSTTTLRTISVCQVGCDARSRRITDSGD
jgi:hypothetical protein